MHYVDIWWILHALIVAIPIKFLSRIDFFMIFCIFNVSMTNLLLDLHLRVILHWFIGFFSSFTKLV